MEIDECVITGSFLAAGRIAAAAEDILSTIRREAFRNEVTERRFHHTASMGDAANQQVPMLEESSRD